MQNEMDVHHNIERNIVKEIMRECYPKKIYPNENFVAYFIKLLLLDPNWGVTDDFVTSRENVAKFVAFVIRKLEDKNDPKLITLEMQFYFTCNLENINNVVKKNRGEILERLVRLKNEICRVNNPDSESDVDNIMKLIVFYITLVSGLGNPMENEVYLEALAAFKSVMNEEEVKEFMGFSLANKEAHLSQLVRVVGGIRLFNKSCDLGGAQILDLPTLLDQAVYSIKEEVQAVLKKIMDKVNVLTTIVDKSYVLDQEGDHGEFKMVCKLSNEEELNIEEIKDLLIFYRQCELFIRRVLEELQNIEDHSNDIYEGFQLTLKEIFQIVNVKIAVPARMVFPLFEVLSNKWTELQNQVMLLTRYSKIITNLIGFSKNVNFNKEQMDSILESTGPHTDAQRLQETANLRIKSLNPEVEVTKLQNFPNIDDIYLQYLGFCSWKLVKTKGGLIPGNPSMGVATYKKMNFVFSVPQACLEFSRNPEELVHEVLHLGRKKPHLINFLLIKGQLEGVADVAELTKVKGHVKLTQDKKIQTKYISRSKIDRNYYWNVWDLKRQALQLANLSKRKTVSTQTHKSHFINTVNTQTYEMRDKEIQTKKDNYTNVPKPSTFIFGLRGRRDDKQFTIDLTRPV
ncbi:cilia- and flagella-associated protein 206-like [Anoplophora glabripennis]|uniref:cilia- and flagella-associated protein 206-like n=1 Tax=Anoplophora glabripennis TaxID=217634 RepID=UPI000873CA8E|nr:cilia- and flagella-associated protein 206-like [Anoplophora glabripennis]